ncbi:transglycosylase domain-containing protein [Prosthecobacter sp.]|uniref:transglycosylase domain-containing protein n=1 Tax=Prosthecobacter sp. TaxID=1965333 RepID=UPI001D4990A4|nr:transglycosylase domain-containing protein [Prosthecobacter sp.]MCB1277758.1 transglycosylase domain-containing protein [Prosthecobacter sp.]
MFRDDPDPQPVRNWRGETGLKLPFYRRGWFSALMALGLLGVVAAFGCYSVVVAPLRRDAEKYDLEELKKLEAASIIFDRDGEEMARLYVLNRTPVPITDVPQHLIDALVAQEDSRFFKHDGVDYIGLARAVKENVMAREVTQGASTITQQLARQTFKLLERSYKRKILEAFIAQRIEKQFSKSEILELYLNRIFFGINFYGVQAASRGYFGKDVKELSIEESATIVGLIKSPNNIQPIKHPERALKERNYVLERMSIEGTLTREEAAKLKTRPLVTAPQSSDPRLSYVFDAVRREVVDLVGEERASIGGFHIYTSIDQDLQKAAEEAVNKRLAEVEKRAGYEHQTFAQFRAIMADYRARMKRGEIDPATPKPLPEYLQAAALMIDNNDGSILAMVGGRDFADSQFNRATDGVRSVGTAFTPLVYAAAFSSPGIYPGTKVEDAPLDNRRVMIGGLTGILGEWGAEVDNPKWSQAPMSSREALVQGRNSATVRLGERVGVPMVKQVAQKAGITTEMRDYPSTFLGASEARLSEMCLAYSNFPTLGSRPQKLNLIQRITDSNDKAVFQISEAALRSVQSMDPIAAYQTHTCLVDALHVGTGSPAVSDYKLGEFVAGGKTGTHYEFKDLWFLGYTSGVTCGVWAGFDKAKTIYPGAFSNRIVLPVWVDMMNSSVSRFAPQEIQPPQTAERVEMCQRSGMRATDYCYEKIKGPDGREKSVRSTYFEYLRPGTPLEGFCTLHTGEGLPSEIQQFRYSMPVGGIGSAPLIAEYAKWAHIEPIRMKALTVVGDDPYNSEQAVPRASPVNDDGTPIRKAIPVDAVDTPDEGPTLKLAPPPPMKIEL